MTTINLSQSLALFEDNLDDIMDAVAVNLTDKLEALEEPTVPKVSEEVYFSDEATVEQIANFIRWEVHRLRVEAITETPLRIIRRIQSRKYYQSVEGQQNIDRITDEDIARAKDTPIEELYDGQLKRSGSKQWGVCPFHDEKTGSFCIHGDNRWSCFGQCGIHGDSIDFVMKQNDIKFIPAVKSLVR